MRKLLIGLALCATLILNATDPAPTPPQQSSEEVLLFAPPASWKAADPAQLPPSVQFMVFGDTGTAFPPTMNLAIEEYPGTLKEYLQTVKAYNASLHAEWKDLGPIQTQAGKGNLSQVDVPTQWGTVRLMHVILIRQGQAFILTASALVDEFPRYYAEFFKAMQSIRFGKPPQENDL